MPSKHAEHCKKWRLNNAAQQSAYFKEHNAKRQADPKYRAYEAKKNRRWHEDHKGDPDVLARKAAKMREYRADPERRPKHLAREALNRALKSGNVMKGPCAICGNKKVHGHHEDYSKPLEVIWLCRKHHDEHHAAEKLRNATAESASGKVDNG